VGDVDDTLAPPASWSAELREQWGKLGERYRRLGKEMMEENAIDVAAQPVFLTYLRMTEACDHDCEQLAAEGEVLKDRFQQLKRNPRADLYRDHMDRQLKSFRMLGFDQEARGATDQARLF
jgi:phage terminase small subunit